MRRALGKWLGRTLGRGVAGCAVACACAGLFPSGLAAAAQSPAAAPAAAAAGPQRGTVKAISGNTLTVLTDAGPTVSIAVPAGTKVQQLAPGSTDLKTATPSQLSDIAVGDRVLAAVKAGDSPETYTARVVVLMKSSDIAEKNAAEQADWRKNGTGGIVSAVDPNGTILVAVGARKVTVTTSAKTKFQRFTGDSVQFKDAKPGTLAQIHAGDQIQARGEKSADGLSVEAEQVVSGSFKNLSGLITSVDAAAQKITLKDLATKKNFTVNVTANSDLRAMPAQMAAMMSARANGGGAAGGGGRRDQAAGSGARAAAGQGGTAGEGGMRRSGGGGDLSQMITRMPADSLANLKPGQAVMIVATEPEPGATTVTAVTLLTGVEPILTANPNGGVNLGNWSMGGGPAE